MVATILLVIAVLYVIWDVSDGFTRLPWAQREAEAGDRYQTGAAVLRQPDDHEPGGSAAVAGAIVADEVVTDEVVTNAVVDSGAENQRPTAGATEPAAAQPGEMETAGDGVEGAGIASAGIAGNQSTNTSEGAELDPVTAEPDAQSGAPAAVVIAGAGAARSNSAETGTAATVGAVEASQAGSERTGAASVTSVAEAVRIVGIGRNRVRA